MIDLDNDLQPKNAHPNDTVSLSKSTSYDTESLRSSVSDMDSCLIKKPRPSSGCYVIQVPKDQIYRVPPPENARLFESYSRRGSTHHHRCCCCCPTLRCAAWTAGALLLVAFALAATVGIVYLVSRPKLPRYTLDGLAIKGFNFDNLTSTSNPTLVLSPEFEAQIRADNPNKKIEIHYRDGSSASVGYSDVALASGPWPAFRQGTRNVTVFRAALKGSDVRLSSELLDRLRKQQARGEVPLEVNVRVRIRVKLGPVTSWTFRVKVKCDVVVDKLAANSRIVSKNCDSSGYIFG